MRHLFIRSPRVALTPLERTRRTSERTNERDILIVRFIMSARARSLAMTMTDAAARRIAMRITNKYRTLCSARASNAAARRWPLGWVSKMRARGGRRKITRAIKLNCERAAFHQIAR